MGEYIEKQEATTIPVMPKRYRKYQTMNLDDAYEEGWDDALKCIEKIRPADVRPVVHGRWVPRDLRYGRSHYFCSACEMTVDMPTAMGVPMFRYCPYCGAGLRGGDPE